MITEKNRQTLIKELKDAYVKFYTSCGIPYDNEKIIEEISIYISTRHGSILFNNITDNSETEPLNNEQIEHMKKRGMTESRLEEYGYITK